MKKVLIIIISVFLILSCKYKGDEQAISSTLSKFYTLLNNNEFNDMNKVCSPNMDNDIKLWKTFAKEKVKYSTIKITFIEIEGEKARANVSTTDEFGNEVVFLWNLIKIKNDWKIDNYSISKSNVIEKTLPKVNSTLQNIDSSTESPTELIQETQTNTTK